MPPESVKKLLNPAGYSLDEHDFDAEIVAQMHMCRGQNQIVIIVLSVSQFLAQPGQVVIVDESHRADGLLIFLPFDLDQPFANHVADEF